MGTPTAIHNLYRPTRGETEWADLVNANCDTLDLTMVAGGETAGGNRLFGNLDDYSLGFVTSGINRIGITAAGAVTVPISLNIGGSIAITSVINDDSMAAASAVSLATSESCVAYIGAQDAIVLAAALAAVAAAATPNHSDLVLDDGTNPHSTTKGDLGLDTTDNVQFASLGIGKSADTLLHVYSAAGPAEIRIETSNGNDPTLSFKSTNTPNMMKISLDESVATDNLRFIGQTNGVATLIDVIAKAGQNCSFRLYSGANSVAINKQSSGDVNIINLTEDKDIYFKINDGGVSTEVMRLNGSESRVEILALDVKGLDVTQDAATSGSPTAMTLTGGAHTTLAASVEATDVLFDLDRTVQFATGALTEQKAFSILAPTYAFVGASVIDDAATVHIANAPQAGANATITNAYALWVEAGANRLGGSLSVGGTSTLGGRLSLTENGTTQIPASEGAVADDGSLDIPDATAGWLFVTFDEGADWALVNYTDAGVVTLVMNSANVLNTDTDGSYCIFDNGTQVRIRNRIGAQKNIKYVALCN